MKTTLTELIKDSIQCLNYQKKIDNLDDPGFSLTVAKEEFQLATNALEERINEMIDARIQEALKNL